MGVQVTAHLEAQAAEQVLAAVQVAQELQDKEILVEVLVEALLAAALVVVGALQLLGPMAEQVPGWVVMAALALIGNLLALSMLVVAVAVQLWTFQHLGQGALVVQAVAVAAVILMELLERRVQLIQVAVAAVELIYLKVMAVMAAQGLS